jgi:hypothetical protein
MKQIIRVPGQALREQRAEPGPLPVDALRHTLEQVRLRWTRRTAMPVLRWRRRHFSLSPSGRGALPRNIFKHLYFLSNVCRGWASPLTRLPTVAGLSPTGRGASACPRHDPRGEGPGSAPTCRRACPGSFAFERRVARGSACSRTRTLRRVGRPTRNTSYPACSGSRYCR